MCPSTNTFVAPFDAKPESLARQMLKVIHLVDSVNDKGVEESFMVMINESGLTVPQVIALLTLRFESVQSVGEIADRTRLSRPATSHLVDRLVVMGLVVRVEDERDRRQKQISLTPKGGDLVDQIFQSRIAQLAAGLKRLSPETRTRLCEAFEAVSLELKDLAPACRHIEKGDA
jgi:MarR family transcriptional regulator, organic hydroperoxide resistance regulator